MTAAARAQSPRQGAERRENFTPVNRSAIRSRINPKLLAFLTALEDFSAERTPNFDTRWGIVYDADLRPMFGSDDTIGRLWSQAEDEDQPGGPYLKRIRTAKGARMGFIWLRRLNDRPVATAGTFDQARAELERAVAGRKGRAWTVPMESQDLCTYRRIAGAPTAELRVHLPQNCGGSEGPPLKDPARSLEENTLKTTTTRTGESSSFLDPSTQDQEPERLSTAEPLGPVPSDQTRATTCTHVKAEDPPSVPELPPELVAHQAILAVIVARFVAFFGKSVDQARAAVLNLFGEFRARAKILGYRWDPEWFNDALDETEKAKAARKIKGNSWVYFRGVLDKYAKQGGPTRDGPTDHQARATLAELLQWGWTIMLKPDGIAHRARIRADACTWEELPESLRRRVKEQKDPILELLRATSSPPTEHARL